MWHEEEQQQQEQALAANFNEVWLEIEQQQEEERLWEEEQERRQQERQQQQQQERSVVQAVHGLGRECNVPCDVEEEDGERSAMEVVRGLWHSPGNTGYEATAEMQPIYEHQPEAPVLEVAAPRLVGKAPMRIHTAAAAAAAATALTAGSSGKLVNMTYAGFKRQLNEGFKRQVQKKQWRHVLMTTRFNTQTFAENRAFIERFTAARAAYGCPMEVANYIPKQTTTLFVLEMHNDWNRIVGVSAVLNQPFAQPLPIYSDNRYNRVAYVSRHHLTRADLERLGGDCMKNMLDLLDMVCFYGQTNLKRGNGITLLPPSQLYNLYGDATQGPWTRNQYANDDSDDDEEDEPEPLDSVNLYRHFVNLLRTAFQNATTNHAAAPAPAPAPTTANTTTTQVAADEEEEEEDEEQPQQEEERCVIPELVRDDYWERVPSDETYVNEEDMVDMLLESVNQCDDK